MDGVLIDSEPLWQEAEIEIFGALGLTLTREMCQDTMGLRIDEVVAHWHSVHAWEGPSQEEVIEQVVTRMAELIRGRGEVKEGVRAALAFLRDEGVALAIASSSVTRLIDAVVDGSGLRDHFDVIHSAEKEPFGKPHPGVYLATASELGVEPARCLAIEDSLNGVKAAKAAGMFCIAIPGTEDQRSGLAAEADLTIASLNELPETWNEASKRPSTS